MAEQRSSSGASGMPSAQHFAENRRRWAEASSGTPNNFYYHSSTQSHAPRAGNQPHRAATAPSPSSSLITLSPQGAAKLMEVAQDLVNPQLQQTPLPIETRAQLFVLIRDEIATRSLTIAPNDRDLAHLRAMLLQSFGTNSQCMLPKLSSESLERCSVGMHLSFYVLRKTPTSTLSPGLQAFKATMLSEFTSQQYSY